MSNKLAQKPRITPHHREGVNISAFGEKQTSFKHLGISTVNVETLTGKPITISFTSAYDSCTTMEHL